jgi:hypothetical protein
MLVVSFIWGAGGNIVAELIGVVASAVVGIVIYLGIEHRLSIQRDRLSQRAIGQAILSALSDELSDNLRVAEGLQEYLPRNVLPYSAFEVNGWNLVSQVPAITTLEANAVKALVEAYGGLRSANEQHRLLFDFTYGGTAAISFVMAGTATTPEGRAAFQRIEDQRRDLRDRLIRRVENLIPTLRSTLSLVHEELLNYPDDSGKAG